MLTLLNKIEKTRNGLFRCDCGVEKEIRISAVKSGSTKSCGCHRRKVAVDNGKKAAKHGLSKHPLYRIWVKFNKQMCDEWSKDFQNFYNWANTNFEEGSLLGRSNEDKYSPSNSYWGKPQKIALENRERTNVKKYGVKYVTQHGAAQQKKEKTNLERYGFKVASKSIEAKANTIKNNRKKYGVDYPQQLEANKEKARQLSINSGQANFINGKTGTEWANELNVNVSTFNKILREQGFDAAAKWQRGCSVIEQVMADFLSSESIEFKQGFKISNYYYDFLLPNHKIIIECDGLYWHSDAKNSNRFYHQQKLLKYEELGYRAFFFREDEINNKFDIIKSIVKNALKQSEKIYARKCEVCEIPPEQAKQFMIDNHLMGKGRGKCFGLKLGKDIVAGLQIINRNDYIDISRFANKKTCTVIGGFSRLIKAVSNLHQKPIHTFVDRRYGQGYYLLKIGFKKESDNLSFCWTKNGKRVHRMKFKSNSGYDYGWNKIWDCGQVKYVRY